MPSKKTEEELEAERKKKALDLQTLTKTEEWNKIRRINLMAREEEANFDEMDVNEADDSVSDFSDDDKTTPWAPITDDGKTPGATPGATATPGMTMNKIEDEVWMVAFDYNVMTYRQYGDDLKYTLDPNSSNQS